MANKTPLERFWQHVLIVTSGCWEWQAGRHPFGYGKFKVDGRTVGAHRWAYEHFVGLVPAGLQLDHKCRNPRCCNPDHLEPVSARENTLRGETLPARNLAKTHCDHGHEFTPENTYLRVRRGRTHRSCKECQRQRVRAFRQRKTPAGVL